METSSRRIYCPKCVGRLEPAMLGKVEIDICYICHGIWLDKGELKSILSTKFSILNFLKGALDLSKVENLDTREHELNKRHGSCPICGEQMDQVTEHGVLSDRCPNGHGTWLDSGELEYIIKKGLRLRYGIFWGAIFLIVLVASRGAIIRTFTGNRKSFGGGLSGGGGSSGGF